MIMAEIKQGKDEDIERIARCHIAAFPKSLSSALGLDYVSVMLRWYLSTENTFLFYAEEGGNCIGYCGGMVKTVWGIGSASSMAQYSFEAAVTGFFRKPWLIFHPEVRAKYIFIFRNVFNRFLNNRKLKGNPSVVFEPYTGLVVIGVDPLHQGKGYGSLLLEEFEKITRNKGLRKMVLSVLTENTNAIASYSRNGWLVSRADKKSTSMEKLLIDVID